MRFLRLLLCALLSPFSLAGCDAFNLEALQPGESTAIEVNRRLGQPDKEWRETDGSLIWEYSRQPEGTRCYMITIGADGILRSIEQVLTEANYRRIRPGMSEEAVRRVLGRPAGRQSFELSGETVWRWHIAAEPPLNNRLYFTVQFDRQGRVISSGQDVEYRS